MSAPLYPPSRPQSIAEVLDLGFRIFRASLIRCLPYGVLSMLASQLVSIYTIASGRPPGSMTTDPVLGVWFAVGLLLSLIFNTTLVLRQAAIVSGNRTDTATELRVALRRLPELIAMAILTLLALGVGSALLILPGVYLMIGLVFTWQALLLVPLSPLKAMRYSLRLTRGYWWRTLLILTVAVAVLLVFYAAGLAVAMIVMPFAGGADVALVTSISSAVIVAMNVVGAPFLWALMLAAFGDLQARTEGVDLERRMAEVAPGS